MTYSHLVIWLWVVALVATLVGSAAALRALVRAEAATARVVEATDRLDALPAAVSGLDAATRSTARSRLALHTRAHEVDP